MNNLVTIRRVVMRRGAVVALAVLAGCTVAGANESAPDQQGRVAPEALDALAPVDREAFQRSRFDLNYAVWETVEAEWASCIERDGLVVDSNVGFELSWLRNVASYDFIAPSVIRDQGGANRHRSAAAAALTPNEAASIQGCNDRVRSVLEGQPPSAAGVDGSRLEAARSALQALESGASTFPQLYAEVERQVADGEWQTAVECLRDRRLEIPDAAADSPTATLEVLGIPTDGSQGPAEVEQLVTEAQPRLDAYIECSTAFYEDLSTELTRYRTEVLEAQPTAFVALSEALDDLNVNGTS